MQGVIVLVCIKKQKNYRCLYASKNKKTTGLTGTTCTCIHEALPSVRPLDLDKSRRRGSRWGVYM